MYFQLITILLGLVKISICSLVVDSISQNGMYVTDYCPRMPYCAEGAHVMCMYYNPHSIMGPRCHNGQNISITSEIAAKFIDISNAIRSKIALGKEKGKSGEYLPRGYGIFRLAWDNELATFAQVLANQCVLRHDLCRATKKFPDPGQTAGLVRFSYPDWFPVSKSGHFTKPGLNDDKLVYAVIQSMKSWYNQKNSVTPNMITNYPDWTQNPNDQGGRLYMEMIHHSSTHIGCGISAYTEFVYYDNNAPLYYNSVQIICNYSTRPRKGGIVYNTTKPTSAGYTVQCGCPPGSDEDEDCLCRENPDILSPTEKEPPKGCSETDVDCKDPTLVLLPIFTMEDAPPSKLIQPSQPDKTLLRVNEDSMEIFKNNNTPVDPQHQSLIQSKKKANLNRRILQNQNIFPVNIKQSPLPRKIKYPKTTSKFVQNRIANKNNLLNDLHKSLKSTSLSRTNKRPSIFTKAQQFHLPIFNKNSHSTIIKTDYSMTENNLPGMHEALINGRNSVDNNHILSPELPDIGVTDKLPPIRKSTLNTAEENIMNHDHIWNENSLNHDTEPIKDQEPKNLLYLLDRLEKEIKTINLKENERNIVDAKIRKIYGSVVGHENLLLQLVSKPQPSIISKYNSIGEEHDTEIETDYNFDNDNKSQNRFSISKYMDKTGYNVDNINKEDIYTRGSRRNHLPNFRNDRNFNNNEENNGNKGFKYFDNKFEDDLENSERRDRANYKNIAHDRRNKNKFNKKYYSDRYTAYRISAEADAHRTRRLNTLDENALKTRKTHNPANFRGQFRNDDIYSEYDEDPLGIERRKYYQNKLDKLQKRIQDRQHYVHNKKHGYRAMRPVLSTDDYKARSKALDTPYIPDRARFLHGF